MKKIILPLLLRIKPVTFQSWVWHSTTELRPHPQPLVAFVLNNDCSFHRTQGIQQASHSQFYTTWQEKREMLNSHPLMVGQWSQRWGHVWFSTPAAAVPRWQGYTWNTQPLTGEVTYLTATVVALHWQGYTWNTQPFTGEVPSNIQPQQPQRCIGKTTLEMHTTIHRWSNQWYPNPTTATTHWQGYTWNTQLFRV